MKMERDIKVTTAFLTHPDFHLHAAGDIHPESAERLDAIQAAITQAGLDERLIHPEVALATRTQLARVHTEDYISQVKATSPEFGYAYLCSDAVMNPHTWQAALRAAGAVIKAVDLVMAGAAQNAFCAVRPPGHHAESGRAGGFCLFNNVAIGAAHALAQHRLQRVAIIDFDVHHGNGTEAIFEQEERVMLCSLFQQQLYPYASAESCSQNIIKIPLPAGTEGAAYRKAFDDNCLPRLQDFRPDIVFISAGFDAHRDDLLGNLKLTEDDYTWITQSILELANIHAAGRVISVLEGGYSADTLASCVLAHLSVLAEDSLR